ncbi:MAG: hypothetical protein ACTHMG_12270 [Sphingomonas sp.]
MSLRISSALILSLALAACGRGTSNDQAATTDAETAAESGKVACAPRGATEFRQDCRLDRVADRDGLILVLTNPDGGFHRLRVTQDGHGVAAADGAEPVSVALDGTNTIQVGIGGDRYRLPATIKRGAS